MPKSSKRFTPPPHCGCQTCQCHRSTRCSCHDKNALLALALWDFRRMLRNRKTAA